MPHIHTEPGQVDFVVDVFVVYENTVLYRFHDKVQRWLVPGGHIELDEDPEVAAVREIQEEVGLEVELYKGNAFMDLDTVEGYKELVPPIAMNRHPLGNDHYHISLVFFATSPTNIVVEPDNEEKSGGILWLTKEEIIAHPDIHQTMKSYGLKALELLGK
jgi:8-oxo-dGTP pyrophosphatase MutT (NUDIX family)